MHNRAVRCALVGLAFLSILFTLSGMPQKGLNYWYLFFSPMVLAASFFGMRGAATLSGAAMVSVLLLYQRSNTAITEYVAAAGLPLEPLAAPAFETYGHAFAGMALMTVGAIATGLLSERRPLTTGIERHARADRAPVLAPPAFHAALQSLVHNAGPSGRAGAVMVAHFPGFTRLVQELGDKAEETLYAQVEARLQTHLRATDLLCRLSSGELAIILNGAGRPQAQAVAHRLLDALGAEPVNVAGQPQMLNANVGVALFPADGDDAQTLLECAIEALHHAHTEHGVYFHRPIVVRLLPV